MHMSRIFAFAFIGAFVTGSISAGEVLEDVVEKTFPLDPSGTLSLRAIDGIVEIFGTDSRDVTISATKKAFSPERLNAIAIRIDARSDAINIETTSPPEPRHHFMDRSGTVEYSINLPQTIASEAMSAVTATLDLIAVGIAHVPVLGAPNVQVSVVA